jgi:hypothetical protein
MQFGVDPVYVINLNTNEVRYYDVERWVEQPVEPPGGDGSGSAAIIGDDVYRAEALPGAPDPGIVSDMKAARDIALDFNARLEGGTVPVSELPADLPFDSAIDLVGPSDSEAGYNRGAMANAVEAYWESGWSGALENASLVVEGFASKWLIDIQTDGPTSKTFEFADGTTVEVEISNVGVDRSGAVATVDFDISVDVNSVEAPGLLFVPQSAGQFNNFVYTGGQSILDQIAELARRYGIQVTGTLGGQCPGQVSCQPDPDDPNNRLVCVLETVPC